MNQEVAQPGGRRVWIYSELYYPEQSATGYYVTHVAEGLVSFFDVHVLCGQPTYLARGMRAPVTETRNGVQIRRCTGSTLNKDIILFRFINLVTISLSIFLRAVFSLRSGDIVIAVTNPPTLPFFAVLACRFRGARFVLRVEDVYPNAMVAAGVVRKESLWVRILEKMQSWMYASTERIVVLGRDMKELVLQKMPTGEARTTLIPNWADLSEIVPLNRAENALLKDLGLSQKFVVQYSGNMGRTHDVESIVECARRMINNDRVHFLFIGWGAKEKWLRKEVSDLVLRNVTILPPQPREKLCLSLNACDASIITFVRGMSGVSVPSRMYNCLAAGKPIIASADPSSELAYLINEESVGWISSAQDPEGLVKAVEEASMNPQVLAAMAERARRVVERSYSETMVVKQYVKLLEALHHSKD